MSVSADKLDPTDLKILKLLQEDGRITNLELSNQIGLSPAPTLERVKKLEKSVMFFLEQLWQTVIIA
jgi:Lrp/AsnC family leucine-responsive transcriptional regulator